MEVYPIATGEQIRCVLGNIVGEVPERVKKEKKVDYPANLLKELELGITVLNEDQRIGLEYAISTLKLEGQGFIEHRFEQGKLKQATFLDQTPDVLVGISKAQAQMFFKAGYPAIGNIVALIESDGFWYDKVAGIGHETGSRLVWVFYREGFISKECEAYKIATDRQYDREKWIQKIDQEKDKKS